MAARCRRGSLRVSDIAAYHRVDVSSITPRLKALEQSGLVVRESLPTDARVSIISITAFGRQALESVHAVRLEIIARALAGADDGQVAAATAVLDAVAGCLAVPDERPAEIRPA